MPGGFDARRRRFCPGGFEIVEALKSILPRIGPYPLGVALDKYGNLSQSASVRRRKGLHTILSNTNSGDVRVRGRVVEVLLTSNNLYSPET